MLEEGEREPKRVRQACLNCRRKKTRCSGEKPVCIFCTRLGQECRWDDGPFVTTAPEASTVGANSTTEASLAARVALLESRLSLLDAHSLDSLNNMLLNQDTPNGHQRREQSISKSPESDSNRKFSSIPDLPVLRSAVDVYFRCCHGQPYRYFNEEEFRRRIDDGVLPSYLILAFLATAARFSDDAFFDGRQAEAADRYSRAAWNEISEQLFSDDHSLNIHTVQTTSMLGVIDYVSGRHELAWVKIGLSVRFAQSLRLGSEPNIDLAPLEREEHRTTFWSVYLLDKLVSCGRHRPPALLDDDYVVRLPSSEENPPEGSPAEMPTLATLCDIPKNPPLHKDDHFALMTFMASVLGSIVRFTFQLGSKQKFPPWDSRSEYARIYGVLLSFETLSDAVDHTSFTATLERDFLSNGETLDNRKACHFVFSCVLYQLNHCLLHHPILLQQVLQSCNSKVPPSFRREAIKRSARHAKYLTVIFQSLKDHGCPKYLSFYSYCVMVSGTIHKLHAADRTTWDTSSSSNLYQSCMDLLNESSIARWQNNRRMHKALQNFSPDPLIASKLLSSSFESIEPSVMEELLNVIDYGWLSDSARPMSPASPETDDGMVNATQTELYMEDWNDFGPPLGTFVSSDANQFPPVHGSRHSADITALRSDVIWFDDAETFI